MALTPKTKIVDGIRVDIDTGIPTFQNTTSQQQNLSEAINSNTLKPTPAFTLPKGMPSNIETAALGGLLDTQTSQQQDQFTANLAARSKQAETAKDSSLQSYLESQLEQGQVSRLSEEYARKGGVDEIEKELIDINNQMLQEQMAFRRSVEATQAEAGLTKAQASQRISEMERKSVAKKADLAVIQMGVQGRYDSAKAIADRSVAAQMEAQINRQNVLKTIYEDNKSLFDKSEQRAFESEWADRERAIIDEKQNKTDIYNLAIEAAKKGASTSLMQSIMSSKTPQEALQVVGNIFGPTVSVPKLQFISGTANQPAGTFNPATGVFTPIDSGTTSTADTKQLQIVNDSTDIMTSPAFNSTFGIQNTIRRNIPGTDAYYLAQKINNFTSQLALASRGQLKGQGTVSDFEGKMLKDAQTALTLNLSPTQAQEVMAKARGAIRTSSGLTARIKIIDPTSGQSQYVEAGQDGINQAITDGLVVEYQ